MSYGFSAPSLCPRINWLFAPCWSKSEYLACGWYCVNWMFYVKTSFADAYCIHRGVNEMFNVFQCLCFWGIHFLFKKSNLYLILLLFSSFVLLEHGAGKFNKIKFTSSIQASILTWLPSFRFWSAWDKVSWHYDIITFEVVASQLYLANTKSYFLYC